MVIVEEIESCWVFEYCFLESPGAFLKTAFAVHPDNESENTVLVQAALCTFLVYETSCKVNIWLAWYV